MRGAICAVVFWGSQAMADPQVTLHMYDEPKPNGAIGEVHHNNQLGNPGIRRFFLETPYGEIEFAIDITPNVFCDPACPDSLEVIGVPMSIVAIPNSITTPEGETRVIILYKWEGM